MRSCASRLAGRRIFALPAARCGLAFGGRRRYSPASAMRVVDRLTRAVACLLSAWLLLSRPAAANEAPALGWETLEPGLELGSAAVPGDTTGGDSLIRVLRIDPTRFEL